MDQRFAPSARFAAGHGTGGAGRSRLSAESIGRPAPARALLYSFEEYAQVKHCPYVVTRPVAEPWHRTVSGGRRDPHHLPLRPRKEALWICTKACPNPSVRRGSEA